MNKIFFTPGPSALYFTVEQHIKDALKNNVASISHRSNDYVKIHQQTVEALRALLNIPSEYHVGFTSSATEVWERSIENLVDEHCYHFVNGSFSEKFYKVAQALGKNAFADKVQPGDNHDITSAEIPDEIELITLVQNETSTGAALPIEDINAMRGLHPNKLIALDVVSACPIADIDIRKIDSLYFSVQKSFGLPAGLGVWIYNDRCLNKAKKLQEEGKYHDTYNGLLNIHKFGLKYQTSCTPNVLNIYLLGKVAQDMVDKGLDVIRRESSYKSALMYNLFETHHRLKSFVKEKKYRSMTVGIAEVADGADVLMSQLAARGLMLGGGYGPFKGQHIRIANFPTHSKEQMEMLIDNINAMDF